MGNENLVFRQKVLLVILDKGLLAIALAIIGFAFNFMLQKQKAQYEYQKETMFAQRLNGCVKLLETSKQARNILRIYYSGNELCGSVDNELMWQEKFADGRWRLRELQTPSGMGRGGTFITINEPMEAIEDIAKIRSEFSFYLSEEIHNGVNKLLETVWDDIEKHIHLLEEQKDTDWTEFSKKAWKRANSAFVEFEQLIRTQLRVEGVILG